MELVYIIKLKSNFLRVNMHDVVRDLLHVGYFKGVNASLVITNSQALSQMTEGV